MTLSELKKLAQSANSNVNKEPCIECGFNHLAYRHRNSCSEPEMVFKNTFNPSTALRMIELLERAAGYIQNAELKECVNCPENSPTPIEECRQCQTARTAYKWLKDLEEL